jgi:uncharacterized protein YqeY
MREAIQKALKDAADSGDKRRRCTLRLMSTAIRDRDVASRERGGENISDREIAQLLSTMVRQRMASAREFESAGRVEEAEEERAEIEIIREFLPQMIDENALQTICRNVVDDIGAHGLRDVGRTMAVLKERYPDCMDFSRASGVVKRLLS